MTNRHQRRGIEKAVAQTPNLSGHKECCGNCRFSANREQYNKIIAALAKIELARGMPAPQPAPIGETTCLHDPQERGKKVWGYCYQWKGIGG